MAETKNGIKYPDNYNSVADIPKDLKEMAESIDPLIENKVEKENGKGLSTNDFTNAYKEKLDGLNNYNDTKIKQDIKDIKDEQKTQNEDISTLKAQKKALEKEVQNLREDNRLNSLTEDNEGELLHIDNSTGSRFNSLEIEGNEKQETREGYNLFDILNATLQNQDKGVTITKNDDGYITANGTPTADWIVFVRDYGIGSKLEDGQTYTLWQENYAEEDMEGLYVQVIANPNEGSTQTQKRYDASTIKKTFTVDKTNYNYQLVIQTGQISKAGTFENYKNRYMLYKGTDDKEFELYGAMPSFDYPSEIKAVEDNIHLKICNKNILDIGKNATVTKGGMTFTTDEDGVLTINGTATTNIYLRVDNNDIADNDIANWAKRILKKGTYVFSVENLSGQTQDINMSAFIRNGAYGQDYTILYRFFKYEKAKSKFVLNEDVEGVVYLWIYSGITLNNAKLKFQLELEQEATDIVANEEQNYVIPVQQRMFKQDKFIKINGVWKEMHTMGTVYSKDVSNIVVSGGAVSGVDGFYRYNVNLGVSNRKGGSYIRLYSNYFKYGDSRWNNKGICGWENGQNFSLGTYNKNYDTAEKLKTFLVENNVEFDYELAKPLYLDCTDEQIAVLDKIEKEAHTYSEVTNVYTEDKVGAIIKTNTNVDLKTVINNVVEAQLEQIGG